MMIVKAICFGLKYKKIAVNWRILNKQEHLLDAFFRSKIISYL